MSKAAELAKMGEVLTNGQIGGRRNIIINGAMQVAQRGTSSTGLGGSSSYYTVDRFAIYGFGSTAGRLTMTQSTDTPNGFPNSVKLECTTADTSIGSGEGLIIGQAIEGQNLQQLKKGTSDAEKVTVSFYVKGNANATYTAELRDQDNTRFNSQEFSVTTSWNRITLTYDGDTTGALDNDNALSLYLFLWLHAGSDFTGGTHTSNVWHTTGNQRVVDNQTSFYDSTDREFFLTGVQLEVGSQATPFEHRSFGEEFSLCSRYYEVAEAYANSYHYNDQTSSSDREDLTATYKVEKRATPSLTVTNQGSGSLSNLSNSTKKATYRRTGSFGSPAAYSLVSEAEL
tara:strand:+ start:476 stop:1501 length:1026 start_codon:yes stop_codon:yes gene_type:complete